MRSVLATHPWPARRAGIGWTLTIAVLALATLAARPGVAQVTESAVEGSATNLLTNPNFDSGLTGWASLGGTATWDQSHDAGGTLISGSLQLSATGSGGSFHAQAAQCVSVAGDGTYVLSGKIFAPTGSYPAASIARLGIGWSRTVNCSTVGTGPVTSAVSPATAQNFWVSVTTNRVQAPASAQSALVYADVGTGDTGTVTANFDNLVFQAFQPVTGPCVPSSTTLCIDDQAGDRRFEIRAHFSSPARHLEGDATATSLSPVGITGGGAFAFFAAANPELLIKVLNGCGLGGHHWVFFAAVTDVGFTVTVRDAATGAVNTYFNADSHAASPVQDTSAFGC